MEKGMKKNDKVIVKSIPERFGDDPEYKRLIGRTGRVLGVRKSDNCVLVKVWGYTFGPISFENYEVELR